MSVHDSHIDRLSRRQIFIIRTCAFILLVLGLMVLIGWIFGISVLTTLGPGKIPMAASAALLFVLYGVTLFLRTLPRSEQKAIRRLQIVVHGAGPLIAWILAALSYWGESVRSEQLGVVMEGYVSRFPFLTISVVTAFCFTLASLSFLASLFTSDAESSRVHAARGLNTVLLVISFVLIFAYVLKMPLFYGTVVASPSMVTSVGFLFMGAALFVFVWPRFSKEEMPGRSSNILMVIFLCFTLGLLVVASLVYRSYALHYHKQIQQQLSAIADLKVSQIQQWQSERLGDARILYENRIFGDLVRRYFNNPQAEDTVQSLRSWLQAYSVHYGYDQVRLMDTKGAVRMPIPAKGIHVSEMIQERIPEVVESKRITTIDFYRHDYDGRIYLSILIPILDTAEGSRVIGVVSLRVDPEKYLYPFVLRWPTPSQTAETLLVRREGNDVLYLSPLKFVADAALKFRLPLRQSNLPAALAILGRTGIVEGMDYQHVLVVADVRPVPGTPWFLVTRINMSEAYAPMQLQMWTVVGFVIALVFGSGAVLAYVWRKQSLEFYQSRAEAAATIRKNSELYHAILATTADGFWLTDVQGKLIDANSPYSRLSGYSIEELLTMQMSDFDAVESSEDTELHRKVIMKTGKDVFESLHRRKDGSVWPVEISSSYSPTGGGRFITFFRDITERKQVVNALRESELIFNKFMEFSPIYVFFKDKNIRALRLSKNFELMLGRPAEEFLGKTMDEMFPSDFSKKMVQDDLRVLKEGKNVSIEENFNGRTYQTIKFPILLNGVAEYLAGFTIDITEQKRFEVELVAAKMEAEAASKSRAQFLDIAVHELRTPVTSFSLLLQLAQKQLTEGKPVTRAFLEKLRDPVDRLTQLVVDLLDVSRLERGQLVVRSVRSDLVSLILKGVEEFRVQVPSRQFNFSSSARSIDVDFDAVRIHQVLSNLLDNAVKYTPEDRSIEVVIEQMSGRVRVSVIDHGDGIPQEQLAHLFTPFSRGASEATVRARGLGLGLAVCRGIIELHGGQMNSLSEVGRGSVFFFDLPTPG